MPYKSVSGYAIEREDGSLAAFIPDSDYTSADEILTALRVHSQISEAIRSAGTSVGSLTVISGARCRYRKEWTSDEQSEPSQS